MGRQAARPARRPSPKTASTALARRTPEQVLDLRRSELEEDLAGAFDLARSAHAPSTRDAYESDREHWKAYAARRRIPSFPIAADHLSAYVHAMNKEGFSVSTIRRRCAALSRWHREEGQPSPTRNDAFREVIQGLLRQRRVAPTKKRAITGAMVGRALIDRSFCLRDRAILAVGFATGLRRSELVALRWNDLIQHPEGFVVRILQSKTDKTGRGQTVAIRRHIDERLCPVTLLQRWKQEASDVRPGDRIFTVYDKMVAEIVKRAVALSGEDPKFYSGHSLRAGMITAAGRDPSVPQPMTQKAARHVRGDQTLDYLDVHDTVTNPAFAASVNAICVDPPARTAAKKKAHR